MVTALLVLVWIIVGAFLVIVFSMGAHDPREDTRYGVLKIEKDVYGRATEISLDVEFLNREDYESAADCLVLDLFIPTSRTTYLPAMTMDGEHWEDKNGMEYILTEGSVE